MSEKKYYLASPRITQVVNGVQQDVRLCVSADEEITFTGDYTELVEKQKLDTYIQLAEEAKEAMMLIRASHGNSDRIDKFARAYLEKWK